MRLPVIVALLILTAILGMVFGIPYAREMKNERLMRGELQAGAIVIEETTVGKVDGIRVGASNLGEGYTDTEGIKRGGLSMWLSVLSGEEAAPILAYPGRVIAIGGKSYRVNRIWASKEKGGWVSLLPVNGQRETNAIDAR